jgi:N-acetylmuramoyl-L-alanine amidase
MRVINHRLCDDNGNPYEFADVKNYDRGPQFKFRSDYNQLEYIVMHHTVSGTLESVRNTFDNPNEKASAHLVIDRDGTILQCVPFDTFAWHAGDSQWADRGVRNGSSSLRNYSIGIEMVNWGPEFVKEDGIWKNNKHHIILPEEEVFFGRSKHGYPMDGIGWQKFPDVQIQAAIEAVKALILAYPGILDIVGHEDIKKAWNGGIQQFYNNDTRGDPMTDRQDPGPAFPMAEFRAEVLGLEVGQIEQFQAKLSLVVPEYRFLCKEPGVFGRKKEKEASRPLRQNEIVEVIDRQWWWAKVRAMNVNGTFLEGWVPERYLKRVKPVI